MSCKKTLIKYTCFGTKILNLCFSSAKRPDKTETSMIKKHHRLLRSMPKQDKITNENNLDIHFINLLRHQNNRGCYRMRLYDFED